MSDELDPRAAFAIGVCAFLVNSIVYIAKIGLELTEMRGICIYKEGAKQSIRDMTPEKAKALEGKPGYVNGTA